jgi:hypothetical protein
VPTKPSAIGVHRLLGALALWATACVGASPDSQSPTSHSRIPRAFDFVTIDGSHLSTAGTAGRVTVVVVITTYDLGSQVMMRELATVARSRTPRINAGAIVLEPPKNAPLVEAYAHSLQVPFPIALADQATLESRGPFGAVNVVPTTIVLDADGNEVWRREGAMTHTEINAVLDGVGSKKP